jgi:hypothetical protein
MERGLGWNCHYVGVLVVDWGVHGDRSVSSGCGEDYVKNRSLDFALAQGPKGQFDVAHLKAIHRHLFQDV